MSSEPAVRRSENHNPVQAHSPVHETSDDEKLEHMQTHSPVNEIAFEDEKPTEHVLSSTRNLVYDEEEEPELHLRTYFALLAMFLLNLVQVLALQGPPSVVCIYPAANCPAALY